MEQTIVACFDTLDQAHRAVAGLTRDGTKRENIRLACKDCEQSVLNPAQDDYPRSGRADPEEFSSAPGDAGRDYNAGLESDDYNRHYRADTEKDTEKQERRDRRHAHLEGPAPEEAYAEAHETSSHPRGSEPPTLDDADIMFGGMAQSFPDLRASGPGMAGVRGDGTRYADIAAAANATNNPGGMSDYLWSSLPVDVSRNLKRQYEDGKTVVIVREPSEAAERILQENGAKGIKKPGFLA